MFVKISVRGEAKAQAIFDAVPGSRTWVLPHTNIGFHQIICKDAKFTRHDALQLIDALKIKGASVKGF